MRSTLRIALIGSALLILSNAIFAVLTRFLHVSPWDPALSTWIIEAAVGYFVAVTLLRRRVRQAFLAACIVGAVDATLGCVIWSLALCGRIPKYNGVRPILSNMVFCIMMSSVSALTGVLIAKLTRARESDFTDFVD